jgi:hypothetical protein
MSSGGARSSYFSWARERRRNNSVIGWLAEMRYLDGALVAPPACADTDEPRDKIDTVAATVTMLFAMNSSILLRQFDLRVSDARQIHLRPLPMSY